MTFTWNSVIVIAFLLTLTYKLLKCTIDLNKHELQYLSDHLTQEECHKLVAALHFQTFDMPRQVQAAERKLPDDVTCLELLLHWNSEVGEGKGGTHVEVYHRLNQIGRSDLANWLSKTVFHQLSEDLEKSLTRAFPEETTRSRPNRVTEAQEELIVDEAPWLTLDSVLSILVFAALCVFGCLFLYIVCLYLVKKIETSPRLDEESAQKHSRAEKSKKHNVKMNKRKSNISSSEDENAQLISKKFPS